MEIKYEDKYIAFIDVLGFSSLVEANDQDKLKNYFNLVQSAFKIFDDTRKQMKKLIISDSIILTAPDTEENFLHVLSAIRTLQSTLAVSDIWVRGGITFGPVFDDNDKNIIVGKGYIKAYLLEQVAIYPRVIIDPSILSKMNLNRREFYLKYNGGLIRNPEKPKLIHDYGFDGHKRYTEDDAIFVCYANFLILNAAASNPEMITQVYSHIRKNLYGEQKHYHKYLWLKKYFLEALEEFGYYIGGEHFPNKSKVDKIAKDFLML